MVYTVRLSARYGALWPKRPVPGPQGLLCVCQNDDPGSSRIKALFTSIAFSPRGDILVTADQDGNIYAFFMKQNRFARVFKSKQGLSAIAFVPGSARDEVLVGNADSTLARIDLTSFREIEVLRGHKRPCHSVSFHPSGRYALTQSPESIVLWAVEQPSWKRHKILRMQSMLLDAAQFDGTGLRILAVLSNGEVVSWDAATLAITARSSAGVSSIAACRHSALITGGTRSTRLHVLEHDTLAAQATLYLPDGMREIVQQSFWNGHDLFVLGGDGNLWFVDIAEHRAAQLKMPQAALRAAISSDKQWLAVITTHGTLRIYDAKTAYNEAAKPRQHSLVRRPAHSENDRMDTTDTSARLWNHPGQATHKTKHRLVPKSRPGKTRGKQSPLSASHHRRSSSDTSAASPSATPETEDGFAGERNSQHRVQLPNALTRDRIESLLRAHGAYPAKYRALIWRFLLKLPQNSDAFEALRQRPTHQAWASLAERFPIQNRTALHRLQIVCSCLAHWSPVFGELPYLPALAFPVVRALGRDLLSSFEILATFFTNWAEGWFDFFPGPPITYLQLVEDLLRRHDLELLEWFSERKLGADAYAWPLLRHLFADVTLQDEWLNLFDHVFSAPPGLLVALVVAYLRYFRGKIMGCKSNADVAYFFREATAMNVHRVAELAKSIYAKTPPSFFPPTLRVLHALPADQYPLFNKYPKFVVDFQMAERKRILLEEADYSRRAALLEQLQKKAEDTAKMEEAFRQRELAVLRAEDERRAQAIVDEERRGLDRLRLDQAAKEVRLQQISTIEASYQRHLEHAAHVREAELRRLEDDMARRRAAYQLEIQSRQDEEKLLNLEFQANQRAMQLTSERERAAAIQHAKSDVLAREKEKELEHEAMLREWASSDEERRLRMRLAREEKERLQQVNEDVRGVQHVQHSARLKDLEHSTRVQQLASERRLRQLAEDEMARITNEAEEEQRRRLIAVREEQARSQQQLREAREREEARAERREEVLNRARRRHALEIEVRRKKMEDFEQLYADTVFQEKLKSQALDEKKRTQTEEQELKTVLLAMEEERFRDSQWEKDLQHKASELQARAEYRDRLVAAEEDVRAQEREKFERLRQQLRARNAEREDQMIRRNEAVLTALAVEREKHLLALEQRWRNEARQQEKTTLRREQEEMEGQLEDLEKQLHSQESKMRHTLRKGRDLAAREAVMMGQEVPAGEGAHLDISEAPREATRSPVHMQDGTTMQHEAEPSPFAPHTRRAQPASSPDAGDGARALPTGESPERAETQPVTPAAATSSEVQTSHETILDTLTRIEAERQELHTWRAGTSTEPRLSSSLSTSHVEAEPRAAGERRGDPPATSRDSSTTASESGTARLERASTEPQTPPHGAKQSDSTAERRKAVEASVSADTTGEVDAESTASASSPRTPRSRRVPATHHATPPTEETDSSAYYQEKRSEGDTASLSSMSDKASWAQSRENYIDSLKDKARDIIRRHRATRDALAKVIGSGISSATPQESDPSASSPTVSSTTGTSLRDSPASTTDPTSATSNVSPSISNSSKQSPSSSLYSSSPGTDSPSSAHDSHLSGSTEPQSLRSAGTDSAPERTRARSRRVPSRFAALARNSGKFGKRSVRSESSDSYSD